ncbi:MAG: DUF302 domain-containing protein [Sulfurimonas sp. RIFOXYD12_FULL_33_39]|uniref:DUF302 domain-containing protein n=1 Tax=unclassified Sulfurimonas TaxID=2623549 RepID=UPI0008C44C94|nr:MULTISPECIES: DUF302 domain-containing protein [unclassified Sulfurimonas]OHE09936.1 MAG: DUF302 domain-containing protein [Sulfurimonas sp. RIFOXYD12_FULL_33_39]OHE13556.1 MAG: DUF302 domain-containing protein [Sulfurimonas sp. RIFOXYD2_FULL_34_21]DAB28797.1 MAG TPA: DUF302 domain-containing protein [Sulfurimonas sp. UBA10385]
MLKKILMGTSTILVALTFSGCTMIKMGTTFMGFESETQKAYADMMAIIGETGDPAQAMMKEWKVADNVSEEDLFENMKELAENYNMRFVGEKNMFRIKDGKPDEVVHARIGEFCSLSIAKKMLNHSRYYGGFMPCRVIFVEYGDGRRYLISMDMTLALYGGTDKKPINKDLFEDMLAVKKAMEEIPAKAAAGE